VTCATTLKSRPAFQDPSKRIELLSKLNSINGIALPDDGIERWPSFPLSVLAAENSLNRFISILDWVIEEAQKL